MAVFPKETKVWVLGFAAGVISILAYWIAVWAMTQAPIALVVALRETSVIFAVLIGILFFGEKADRGKVIATVIIIGGILLMRL